VYFGSKLLNRWETRRVRKQMQEQRYGSGDGTQGTPLDSLQPDVPLITSG
jgi:hypothetical protein